MALGGKGRVAVAGACVLHGLLALGLALTSLPLVDEGFYGVPAFFLATHGKLQNPVLESAGAAYLTGIDRIFYCLTPLAMMLQAAAFKLFGFSLFTQRALSVACGVGGVFAWFVAVRRLCGTAIAGVASFLLAIDFVYCTLSARGRADMMSLCFALAALALYVSVRERSLRWALLLANTGCAASGLIHPNGGVLGLASLLVTIFYLDRKRLRVAEVLVALAPYVVFGGAWAIYIAQDPHLWLAQFIGNVRYRFNRPFTIGGAIEGEVLRYAHAYNVIAWRDPRALRALVPLSYWAAALGCLIVVRKRLPQVRWLLWILAAQAVAYTLTEKSHQGWYTVHIIPVLTALTAACLVYLWRMRTRWAAALVFAEALLLLLSVGVIGKDVQARKYQREYLPMIDFLNAEVRPGETVFVRSEAFYNTQCRPCVRDDEYLGLLSGRPRGFHSGG